MFPRKRKLLFLQKNLLPLLLLVLALPATILLLQQQQRIKNHAATCTGTITGRYWQDDMPANGRIDGGENPVSAPTLTVNITNTTTGVSTSATGNPYFVSVACGTYRVNSATIILNPTTATLQTVTISTQGQTVQANFGTYFAHAVAGTVFVDSNGNGVQDSGEVGLSGVKLSTVDYRNTAISATTDTTGKYQTLSTTMDNQQATLTITVPTGYVLTKVFADGNSPTGNMDPATPYDYNQMYSNGATSIPFFLHSVNTIFFPINVMTINFGLCPAGTTCTTVTPTPTPLPTNTPTPQPTNTPTPTLRPTNTPTSTPRPTVTPTIIPSATPTPVATSAQMAATVFLHGIGAVGDNTNPDGAMSNKNPVRTQRSFTFLICSLSDTVCNDTSALMSIPGTLTYSSTLGGYQGNVTVNPMPSTGSGNYQLKVKGDNSLRKLYGVAVITAGQTTQLPQITLTTGDVNADNALSILDYNIIIGCYSNFAPATSCTASQKFQSDLNDDGNVNETDYNLFLREISTQSGF